MQPDNRGNLLAHALRLFAARGYDAVGVQEIVEAAGVTKPSLYHHFGSKRGLLDALLDERFNELYAQLVQAADYQRDLPYSLTKIVNVFFRFAQDHAMFYRMQLSMSFAAPDSDPYQAVLLHNKRIYALLEDLFRHAAEQHGNMRGRQQRYAFTLHGMIDTYILLLLNGYIEMSDHLVYEAVHQFMHGIFS